MTVLMVTVMAMAMAMAMGKDQTCQGTQELVLELKAE
jgi:hypothetical protein